MASLACLLITWIIAIVTIRKHFKNYYEPQHQRHKVRVLLYPPFYMLLCWLSYLRYDYSTTIMFFATLFEAFAVYNLFACYQSYLQPFRIEAGDIKEEARPTVIPYVKVHIKSRWGMHFRTIIDILVIQYPVWSVISAFISIFAELKGYYCPDSFSFKGAHVYLTIINFIALSIIISALFVYIATFKQEWSRANISAHGMFWSLKGPIMINFYIGVLLLDGLAYAGVIHGTDGTHSSDGLAWSTENVKNGLEVIVECVVLTGAMLLMTKYFGPNDSINRSLNSINANDQPIEKLSSFGAFCDAYVNYIPEFLRNIFYCGRDTKKLAAKRRRMKKQQKQEYTEVTALTTL
ncbi:unnamed protein product [Cunninghamella echinulata]